jgi:glutamate 5-kinase
MPSPQQPSTPLPTEAILRRSLRHSRRLVVKVGSALLQPQPGQSAIYGRLAKELDVLLRSGRQVVLVSSGAIAVGLLHLQVARRPRSLAALQAAAAVGQPRLMAHWADALAAFGRTAAQVLLTHADLAHRGRFLNARRALGHLQQQGVVPIINENDSVATEEIKLGDNDQLAAQVAALVDADLLVLLTSVDGLHRGNPSRDPSAAKVTLVRSPQALAQLSPYAAAAPAQAVGTGGMQSKLVAVQTATTLGVPVVIAHGRRQHPLQNIVRGAQVGTLFVPQQPLRQRHHWIAHTRRPSGVLQVDAGAQQALVHRGSSLLPRGLLAVQGRFERGAMVHLRGPAGLLACGLVAYSAAELRQILGKKSQEIVATLGYWVGPEAVHRDDLVLVPQTASRDT